MKVAFIDNKGKKAAKSIDIDDSVFNTSVNNKLLTQYVYVYLNNQRQSNAQVKDRGEVRGGGRKPWRQKGTGRARHGSIRSPIWRGGGVTFGPSNVINYKKSFNKKMLKKAFQSAFSYKAHNQNVKVFAEFKPDDTKTKTLVTFLKKSGVKYKALIIQNQVNNGLLQASRNLPSIKVAVVNEINPYQVLDAKEILIFVDALPAISKNWGKETIAAVSAKKILVSKIVEKAGTGKGSKSRTLRKTGKSVKKQTGTSQPKKKIKTKK